MEWAHGAHFVRKGYFGGREGGGIDAALFTSTQSEHRPSLLLLFSLLDQRAYPPHSYATPNSDTALFGYAEAFLRIGVKGGAPRPDLGDLFVLFRPLAPFAPPPIGSWEAKRASDFLYHRARRVDVAAPLVLVQLASVWRKLRYYNYHMDQDTQVIATSPEATPVPAVSGVLKFTDPKMKLFAIDI